MKKTKPLYVKSLLLLAVGYAHASVIIDYTVVGIDNQVNNAAGANVETVTDLATGVTFTLTVTETSGSGLVLHNAGIGSNTLNTGTFLNVIGGVSESLTFTVSNVMNVPTGSTASFDIASLLSQNPRSLNVTQAAGFGGTFGQQNADSITITSDSGTAAVVNQSDAGDLGAILLATDGGNSGNTGNTFAHSAGNLGFGSSFTVTQTNLDANDAVIIQGFDINVTLETIPEPSAVALLGLGGLALMSRRKRA